MTDTERLLAIEAIHQLKARYCRFVDTKDWPGYQSLFADDAHFDISSDLPGGVLTGSDKIVATVSASLPGVVSVHHVHGPEIEFTSDTTATGIWAMEDMLRWGPETTTPGQALHGYGHYHETYRKVAGRWVIQTMKLTRLRVDFTPAPAESRA